MSVYTSVNEAQLHDFLNDYDVGELLDFSGIEAGVENTNYFVSTSKGEFVLTIYEDLTPDELSFFLGFMHHLALHQVPTVTPVAMNHAQEDNTNKLLSTLCNKPAALVERLPGSSIDEASTEHCAVIADAIAKVHLAGLSYEGTSCRDHNRANELGEADCDALFSSLSEHQALLLRHELDHFYGFDWSALPHGIVHSDLFRDNCLFADNKQASGINVKLSGIIDFYYACNDALLYDLAVIANDWCFNAQGQLDPEKHRVLLHAYHAVRPITDREKQTWPALLRIAALHYWGFRLMFNLYPRKGESVLAKDASEFQRKIEWHLDNPASVQATMDTL